MNHLSVKLRLFTVIMLSAFACMPANAAATGLSRTIPYKVIYKWGFITKDAGTGTVTLNNSGNTLNASLTGHSIPWGGRIYSVHDTITATVTHAAGSALPTENVIYENGIYTKPRVSTLPDGSISIERDDMFRSIRGAGTLSASPATMEAVTITADMLGLYKYADVIDYAKMQPGETTAINITGAMPGRAEIRYVGPATVEIGGASLNTWQIVFNYQYQGSMSSYPVNAWISVDYGFPVKLSADITIGHVEMIYDPSSL